MSIRILISAYACEPGKGSEPDVGWNWVNQAARFNEVWVMTRARNRYSIEAKLKEQPIPNVHWVYYDPPFGKYYWSKGDRGIRSHYLFWQIGILFVARKIHNEVKFDIMHHATFVNYWMPIFISLLPIPLIWGPVGGGESTPKTFYKTLSFRGRLYEYFREGARWIFEKSPFVRLTAKRAKVGLAATAETEACLKRVGCRIIERLSQVALTSEEIRFLQTIPLRDSNPLRVISIGNLLHLKAFHLSLRAFAQFNATCPKSEYWIIGDGPERENLIKLVQDLKVADKVRFWGRISRQEVFKRIGECDLLLHPSLHESGGWVCVEAMGAGRPVICLDLGGPALQVSEETGFKLPAESPEQVVRDLVDKLNRLACEPELLRRLGESARNRVKEKLNWDSKGELINHIYQRTCIH
jgi:glycosyltransferase involved in cell wall biosynthesis